MTRSNGHPGYEHRDASTRAVLGFGIGLAVLIALAMAVLLLAPGSRRPPPHEPYDLHDPQESVEAIDHWIETRNLLESRRSLAESRLSEWERLAGGRARIPIGEAMRLIVERRRGDAP